MKPKGLDTLFTKKLFRIPDYQRGYAWQINQLKDFWEDLINLSDDRSHYTGVLSLKKISDEAIKEDNNEYWLIEQSYSIYEIVDGQQRLTTCIIFIQCLIDTLKELEENKGKNEDDIFLTDSLDIKTIREKFLYKEKPKGGNYRTYKFGYNKDNPSSKYMRFRILGEENPGTIDETFYTLNLKNAKLFFKAQIEELYKNDGLEGLKEVYKKISKKFLFNEYIIEDEFDVFVAFETMNNRGKSLSKLELLKNRLIYLTTLYPENELDLAGRKDLRDKINSSWKEVYHQLGRNEQKPLNDDEFLKAHWIMTFKYSRKTGDEYVNFLLNDYFSPKKLFKKIEKEVKLESPEEQYTELNNNEDDSFNGEIESEPNIISVTSLQPSEIEEYVNSLKESAIHWYNSYYPILAGSGELDDDTKNYIDKLNRIGMGYFRPLVMSVLKNIKDNGKRCEVFKRIESFIFIVFRLSRSLSNYGDTEFYNTSRELDKGDIDIEEVLKRLNEREDFSYNEDGTFNTKYFEDFMYKKFTIGKREGYYKWNGLQYFLYEYELEKMKLSGNIKVTWKLFVKNEKDKISIEHIYPQTSTEYWKEAFINIDEDDEAIYNGSLGNLLLLSMAINASLQNDSYSEKKKPKLNDKGEQKRMGYSNGSHSEIEVAHKYRVWTPIEIKDRGLELLNFMEERWGINLGTNENKLKLLFLPENNSK